MTKKKKEVQLLNLRNAIILLLFISLFGILKAVYLPQETIYQKNKIKPDLNKEAEILMYVIAEDDSEISLLSSNQLNENRVRELERKDYDRLKEMVGIENDFCIFFEDEAGNLVKVEGIDSGIGSSKIYINGNPCV